MDAGNVPSAGLQTRSIFQYTPEVLASYPTPNYVDPVRRGPILYILNSIFLACMLACVALRFYARIFVRKWFGLDDVFILCAVVGAIGVTAVVMLGFHEYGWDLHVYDIPRERFAGSGQILFASKILWSFTSASVRASVMCLYYRLLHHLGTVQYRWILHANSAFILGLFLAQQTTVIFACWPVRLNWTIPFTAEGKCIDSGAAVFTTAVLNTLSEAIVATLPLPIILSLNLNRRQRRATIGLLCGGFVVVIIGCVRTYYVWMLLATHDPSWWSQEHWICSEVEMDVAIICACVPAITPVLRRVFKGGWKAAKEANPSFSSTPSDFRTHRARSLFNRIKDQNSLTALSDSTNRSGRSRASNKPPSPQQDIDLEGISNDGYGYSVTITTGRGTKVKRRWDIRNKTWHYYPEEPISDAEDEPASAPGSRKRPVVSRPDSTWEKFGPPMDKPTFEVRTEKTFDVRESFHSQHFDRGYDYRNPYKNSMPGKYEEDIEIALQVPAVEANDWSLFDGEVNRRMAARLLPDEEVRHHRNNSQTQVAQPTPTGPIPLTPSRRTSSYESQRYPVRQHRRSLDSIRPPSRTSRAIPVHRMSQSQHDIHLGVLPSPSTATFDQYVRPQSQSRVVRGSQPTPPALPPSARVPRGSPAVQPMNSSKVWTTAPQVWQSRTSFIESNTSSAETSSEDTHPPVRNSRATASTERDRRRNSVRTSVRAENGSGYSMTVQNFRLHPPAPPEYEEASDDEFTLPLQRPSPRNSGYYQRPQEQLPSVPVIQVREYT